MDNELLFEIDLKDLFFKSKLNKNDGVITSLKFISNLNPDGFLAVIDKKNYESIYDYNLETEKQIKWSSLIPVLNVNQINFSVDELISLTQNLPKKIQKYSEICIFPLNYKNETTLAYLIIGNLKLYKPNILNTFYKYAATTIENFLNKKIRFYIIQKRDQFYNISLDLMLVANLRGEIIDLNQQVEFFLGKEKKEILKNSILNYIHPDDINKTIQALSELKKNKVLQSFTNRVINKENQYKNIQWNAISDDVNMHAVGRDITSDEAIKNELIKVNAILNQAEKVTKMGAWELDIATGATYWTDEVYVIHELEKGFDHNKINGIEFYHPDYKKIIIDAIENCIQNQTSFDVTCKFYGAKGTLKWVRSSGIPLIENNVVTKIFGVFIDVTEDEENKIKAQLEKFKLDAIIQGTNVGTWEWNVQTGETVFNEKWAELIGYSLEELQPISINTWMRFANPEDLEKSNQLLQLHFDGKTDYYLSESRMLHKNGTWKWVLDRGKVVSWTKEGKPLMMYGTHQDITTKKELEINLTHQNLLVNQFFDLSPIGLAVNDLKEGKYLRINNALLNIVGYSEEEFLQLNYFDLTPKKYYDEEIKMIESLKKLGFYGPFEKEYIHKNGKLIPVILKGVLVKDDNEGDKIWSVVEDITERKKNDQIQSWNYNFQKLIAKHSTQFVKTSDLNFNTSVDDFLKEIGEFFEVDRAYIFISEDNLEHVSNEFEWCRIGIIPEMGNLKDIPMKEFSIFGENLEKMGYIHIPDIELLNDSEEKREYQRQNIKTLLCAEISSGNKKIGFIGFDSVNSHKNWNQFEIHSLKILANTLADLFLKREKEKIIKENQDKLQSVLNEIEDIVWSIDAKDQSLIFISPSVENLLGYSIEDWKKNSFLWKNLIYFDDKYIEEITDFELKTKGEFNLEFRMVSKFGEIKWVKSRAKNIFDNNGLLRIDGYFTDITKEKNYLNSIEESKKIAEKALKVKDEFLTNISHEIRTPLNAIMGFGEILENTQLNKEQKEVVDIISIASKKLMNILNDVLDVAKFNDGVIELDSAVVDLYQLTKEIIKLQGVKAQQKKLSLNYSIDENVPHFVKGDETRLNQILINIINNSIKFTEKGEVTLHVSLLQKDDTLNTIRFEISDTGIGIPSDKQKIIFDRFIQAETSTSRKYGGTGLGLSIVKSLIELYNGNIELKSDGVTGTKFIIDIPFETSKQTLNYISTSTNIHEFDKLNNTKILLVEDNDFNQLLAKNILTEFDVNLDIAEDGYFALDFLKNNNYDIILMDLQMPNLDGYATTKIIINELKIKTPIIACSAHAQKKELNKCKKMGMADYLAKPYTKNDLISIIVKNLPKNKIVIQKNDSKVIKDEIEKGILKIKKENGNELLLILSEIYLEKIPLELNSIINQFKNKEWDNLTVTIHKLIGSLGTMNFLETCQLCKKIEDNLKQKKLDTLDFDIKKLTEFIQLSLKMIKKVK